VAKLDDGAASIMDDSASVSATSPMSIRSSFSVYDNSREEVNPMLAQPNESPVRSLCTTVLKNQSKKSIRRLKSKLMRGTRAFQSMFRINMKNIFNIKGYEFRVAGRSTYTR
jgi:hypothetical protein